MTEHQHLYNTQTSILIYVAPTQEVRCDALSYVAPE
jgi:hypothetical protein